MKEEQKYDKAKYAIKLCITICVFTLGIAILCYGCRLRDLGINENATWSLWYNYLSPFIAFANVVAFAGLTIALYYGEDNRQKTHERINIQNTIINKLQLIEKDFSIKEKELRSNPNMIDVYSVYISLYKYAHYFKHLPKLSILSTKEHEDAIQVLKKIEEIREIFINFYSKHDKNHNITEEEKQDLAYQLNYLSAYLEEFEISIIQDIALSVDGPK